VSRVGTASCRYFPSSSQSLRISRKTLFQHRVASFEKRVLSLPEWEKFTIWGAGRDGKTFFKALMPATQARVAAFCDIDPSKIGTAYHCPHTRVNVPIVHFRDAKPPIVLCVALNRTAGEFEANVASLGLKEGVEFWHFA
jgi:hypothetical protein